MRKPHSLEKWEIHFLRQKEKLFVSIGNGVLRQGLQVLDFVILHNLNIKFVSFHSFLFNFDELKSSAWEAFVEDWHWRNISSCAWSHTKAYQETLYLDGRSQNLPDSCCHLASSATNKSPLKFILELPDVRLLNRPHNIILNEFLNLCKTATCLLLSAGPASSASMNKSSTLPLRHRLGLERPSSSASRDREGYYSDRNELIRERERERDKDGDRGYLSDHNSRYKKKSYFSLLILWWDETLL